MFYSRLGLQLGATARFVGRGQTKSHEPPELKPLRVEVIHKSNVHVQRKQVALVSGLVRRVT